MQSLRERLVTKRTPGAKGKKIHNSAPAMGVKVELRRRALEHVPSPRVLDVFCGPVGEMYARVWHDALHYAGIDREWSQDDKRRRFVGDNTTILRSIDLGAYNVFDLDAFGSPWTQMVILAARRRWARGEVGAVVLTDASNMHDRFGSTNAAIAQLLDVRRTGLPPGADNALSLGDMAATAWADRCNVEPIHRWKKEMGASARGAHGNAVMVYSALVFRGRG